MLFFVVRCHRSLSSKAQLCFTYQPFHHILTRSYFCVRFFLFWIFIVPLILRYAHRTANSKYKSAHIYIHSNAHIPIIQLQIHLLLINVRRRCFVYAKYFFLSIPSFEAGTPRPGDFTQYTAHIGQVYTN